MDTWQLGDCIQVAEMAYLQPQIGENMNNINYYLKPLAVALGLLAIYASYKAEAGPFIEVGESHYQKMPNGIWWQDQYPSVFDLEGKYLRIGIGDKLRLSYFDLGHYETKALASGDESRYFAGLCNIKTCAPGDFYRTNGRVRGAALSSVLQWGPVYMEPGIIYVEQKFDLYVEVVNQGSLNGPLGNSFCFSGRRKGYGYMLGLGAEYKGFTVSVNYFKSDAASEIGDFPGIDAAKTLAVGYRF